MENLKFMNRLIVDVVLLSGQLKRANGMTNYLENPENHVFWTRLDAERAVLRHFTGGITNLCFSHMVPIGGYGSARFLADGGVGYGEDASF